MFYTSSTMNKGSFWQFVDDCGTFTAKNPQNIPSLYFPLTNEAEMMSAITPQLKGDIKSNNNSFLTSPATRQDIMFGQSVRNIWIYSKGKAWSIADHIGCPKHRVELKAGLLYHTVKTLNSRLGLEAEITNFVPATNDCVELMLIKVTNQSKKPIDITLTSAIPLFCRSADNIRDHHQVTSLLNRIKQEKFGISVKPVMSFDERGHKKNNTSYFICGIDGKNKAPQGSFPTLDDFLSGSANVGMPFSITNNIKPRKLTKNELSGKEAIGALRFNTKKLKPKESVYFGLILGISEKESSIAKSFNKFNTIQKIKHALNCNQEYWQGRVGALRFDTGNDKLNNWLQWVSLEPMLRKIYGCSFLPDFDYGRGGKGWRDLWQDCLTLLLKDPKSLRKLMIANFSGVRIDGTNATIITKKPGEFIADRNKISRVWMDHGIWPFFTLDLYMAQTGDLNTLLQKTTYFKDAQLMRARAKDPNASSSTVLKTKSGKTYKGTILEHVLIEHLVQFFNVGTHNCIRLENADWNDGLDMAYEKGESVAFSAFYAYNLNKIADVIKKLKTIKKVKHITILNEVLILLDTLNKPINYDAPNTKIKLLNQYLSSTKLRVSGKSTKVPIDSLIKDLSIKAIWLFNHIYKNEWIDINKDVGFFNGYYDNKSRRVEGKSKGRVRMTLTGQVFPILSGIASDEQIRKIYNASIKYLQDKKLKGFRLNTNFGTPQFDLGRAFAFAYGEKENGAIFSHMCVMFACGLYRRGFVKEGYNVLNSLYKLATNSNTSKIYPNLPEYFNLDGQGMYSYLTGSASWYIMTLLTEVFGVRGYEGDLIISPKFTSEQFKDSNELSVRCNFADKIVTITYYNPKSLSYPDYAITKVNTPLVSKKLPQAILIKRRALCAVKSRHIDIRIILG
ncbi:GH36-type glycosyl hydrolase domain-containing protein [Thermoproteota archaeon]